MAVRNSISAHDLTSRSFRFIKIIVRLTKGRTGGIYTINDNSSPKNNQYRRSLIRSNPYNL